ncbi:MAG: alpha/beta hydrolase [Bacteroidales bacterium]|nr:alpha/beta hydrolase [Bacteroidales bacterium]
MKIQLSFRQGFFLITMRSFFYAFILFIFFTSCEKEKENNEFENFTVLTDYSYINSYTSSSIKLLLSTAAIQYPEMGQLVTGTKYDIDIYSLEYKTSYKNSEITGSGLLCVPNAEGEFPLLSFQNGTNTKHANAPTENPGDTLYLLLELLSGNGYIIFIPDYIGFGTSADVLHPYYQRETNNAAIIDMLNAGKEFLTLSNIQANTNNDLFVMGYSQGGWATLSVLDEIENNINTNFNVVAASCGAGAYNLRATSDYILSQETFPGPLYLPYYIESHRRYGSISEPLQTYFKEPYASRIPGLFDGLHSNSEVNAQLSETVDELVTDDLLNNLNTGAGFLSLRNELIASSVEAWSTSTFLRFYHGTADLNVPPSESQNIYDDFKAASSSHVEIFQLPSLTHETALIPWGIKSFIWFNGLK